MAVTLYRQVGKGKLDGIKSLTADVGADRPISLVPISYGTRSPTALVRGSMSATTLMRLSPRRAYQECPDGSHDFIVGSGHSAIALVSANGQSLTSLIRFPALRLHESSSVPGPREHGSEN
jgi:hypothetical protein